MIGANGQQVALLDIGGRTVEVDAEIAPIVRALNACGVATKASCSGHGYRPGNIALRDGREIIIARDFNEARIIDRLFPLSINGRVASCDTRPEGGDATEIAAPFTGGAVPEGQTPNLPTPPGAHNNG